MGVSQLDCQGGQQLLRARVAVLLDASNTPHYIDNGREPYERAAEELPWTTFEFFDQHTFDLFTEALERRDMHAFVIASGSLDGEEMRQLVRGQSFVTASHEAIRSGTGAVVLHQHPPASGTLNYGFLPDTLAVEVSRAHTEEHYLPADNIDGVGALDVLEQVRGGVGKGLRGTTRLTGAKLAEALCRGQRGKDAWHRDRLLVDSLSWDVVAREREDGDLLLVRSRLPGVSAVVSAVPFDWNGSTLLSSLVALALRERGCLYLRATVAPDDVDAVALKESDAATLEPHVQRLEDDGLFVAEQSVALEVLKQADCNLHACTLGAFFGTLAFSTAWHLPDLPWLTGDDILRRLECKGSLVVSCAAATGRDMLVEIARPPVYAQHAQEFADWLTTKTVMPEHLSPFELRAVVAAVATIEAAFRDRAAVPRAVARDHLAKLVAPELVTRARDGNIDTDPLRTAAVLAIASSLAGGDLAAVARRLTAWLSVEENFRNAAPYELIQALVWNDGLWDARLGEWLRERKAAWEGSVWNLPYALILASRHEALGSQDTVDALVLVARDDATPVVARGEVYLELARLSESGNIDGETLLQLHRELIRAKRWLGQQIAALRSKPGAVEAVSVLTAALVEIAKREAVGVTGRESDQRRYPLETDQLAVAAGRAEERRADLQRTAERAHELESQGDWLRVMVGFLALLTAGLGAAMAAVFVGWSALLGTLIGMLGFYVTLATWGPRLAPQLAALPGGRKPPTAR